MVSVIVPCYNQGQFLRECLDSVLCQTYNDWECIIVNDGSTDNSLLVAEDYCKADKRFICLNQQNMGVSVARNNGIRFSHGSFILPLDADDKIASSYIEKAINCFDTNPGLKLVYCQCEKFGRKSGLYKLPDYNYEDLLLGNMLFTSCFFRRSDFDRTDGYNPNMKYGLEDWDFWLSLLQVGDIVYRIDEVLFYYRSKSDSRGHGSVAHMDELKIQIYHNHPELYSFYTERIIDYLIENKRLKEIEKSYSKIVDSIPYKFYRVLANLIKGPFYL